MFYRWMIIVLLFWGLPACGMTEQTAEPGDGVSPAIEAGDPVPETIGRYHMLETAFYVNAQFDDPYDPGDIKLDARIDGPDGSLSVPLFYEHSDSEQSVWKLRFTPRNTGTYHGTIRLQNRDGYAETDPFTFRATSSQENGFLTLPDNGSHFYLEFDSGEKFRGVGENFGWEDQPGDGEPVLMFTDYLETLGNQGINIIRTWMNPWTLPLIWTQPDNPELYEEETEYRYNRSAIERTDLMFREAMNNGIYVILVLDYHGALLTEPDYWGGNNYWPQHPDNVVNGGSAEEPADFFTEPMARKNYKDRLRFIIARWGAFTNLATIELWNEIDNAMEDQDIPAEPVVAWHDEMTRYLKDKNPYPHLVSTSVSHRYVPGLFDVEGIDYTHIHMYGNTDAMPQVMDSVRAQHQKPVVVGEIGYDWRRPMEDQVELFNEDLHKSFWNALLEPTPILPMPWWWEFFYVETDNEVKSKFATFNQEMMHLDWDDLEVVPQPDIQGVQIRMAKDRNIHIGLVTPNDSWHEDGNMVYTGFLPGQQVQIRRYDTHAGHFLDDVSLPVGEGGQLSIPGNWFDSAGQLALIITQVDH